MIWKRARNRAIYISHPFFSPIATAGRNASRFSLTVYCNSVYIRMIPSQWMIHGGYSSAESVCLSETYKMYLQQAQNWKKSVKIARIVNRDQVQNGNLRPYSHFQKIIQKVILMMSYGIFVFVSKSCSALYILTQSASFYFYIDSLYYLAELSAKDPPSASVWSNK